jgi:hypothetical protein
MKISIVTTFHKAGYEQYGQRMIQSFLENWPKTVTLHVYAEDVEVLERADNLIIHNLHGESVDLVKFKTTWKNIPKANGDVSDDPIRNKRKDAGKGFKWDAVRFSHKVYSIFHCAKNYTSDVLMWMDADMVCHSLISQEKLEELCGKGDLCFLGRIGKYTECGLYSMNLNSQDVRDFLNKFQQYYDNAEQGIFTLDEWHDSFVFDEVRKLVKVKEFNWAGNIISGEGHPLINCEWGAYLDHLKGDRKQAGKSKSSDLRIKRTESYWK